MVDRANYDAKKYQVCFPWKGQRGPEWSRFFKPAFEDGLHRHTDNFSSLHQFLVTQDDYGGANGPPHPAGAGMGALGVQSTSARATRTSRTYGFILVHIENEDICDAIKSHVANVLPVAPAAHLQHAI